MNPSAALARVLLDELVRGGVREAVLSPGSRNAPLAFALQAADAADRLRLHVRIDERSAGFLALGLAKASGLPVPVVTTSGTAAVNLHPAVVEASHAGVPLLALTADRPPELRGVGANQAIDQIRLFGDAVRLFAEVGVPETRSGQNAYWRSLAARALLAASGAVSRDPGPVHLNVALREPLVPDPYDDWVEPLEGRTGGGPWTGPGDSAADSGLPPPTIAYDGSPRTLVVVGDCPDGLAYEAAALARDRGWPLVAEPVTPARVAALDTGTLLLATPAFLRTHRPDRVLVAGRPTLSRAVLALLRDPDVAVDVVTASPRWADPAGSVRSVTSWSAPARGSSHSATRRCRGDAGFLAAWRDAAAAARHAADEFLRTEPGPTGLHVARTLVESLPGAPAEPLLVLGSSSPVRDLDLVGSWPRRRVRVLANRGAAGIDGVVSTAVGAALAGQRAGAGPAYALLGDLTFLHDANSLVMGPQEPRPDLTIVVVNDDGGGIFGRLEQGAPEHGAAFERIFGTPTRVDLAALCSATGTVHVPAVSLDDLTDALVPRPGLRVVEARVDRSGTREVHARLHAAVAAALSPG